MERARAGDERAFAELTDPYRRELQVHCYRIMGSLTDAEDMLQETMLAAWRGLAGFQETVPADQAPLGLGAVQEILGFRPT